MIAWNISDPIGSWSVPLPNVAPYVGLGQGIATDSKTETVYLIGSEESAGPALYSLTRPDNRISRLYSYPSTFSPGVAERRLTGHRHFVSDVTLV
jgi:hypothetical protein